ncbi:NADP-specific glutamate dehydrogenase [Cribrihabitans neustonicus]|uniref:NADP-specific glutamate dehydrogenase n=1 Tax=Cribrihabitans neustonicus TaxID=1429085 RepID=UPI003B5B8933
MSSNKIDCDSFLSELKDRTPGQEAFHQAVGEVVPDILPVINDTPEYRDAALLRRLVEPDRVISFRVEWVDDDNCVQVNCGHRVQFNSAIGPYKGGLRFHPSVDLSILKFLGFEQTFKNALTGLPMGGGKGGADFDPSGRSPGEIMRFCQAFMVALHHYIGPNTDVPAGDINVGAREIGWLFGAYRRITNEFQGALTGKGESYGGSEMRTEATGDGVVQFLGHMLERHGKDLEGKRVAVSGAGNVATHAAELALRRGAKVLTLSDSRGFIHDKDGLDEEKLAWVRGFKAEKDGSLEAYSKEFGASWQEGSTPWGVECDVALPCATQNELDADDAEKLVRNGCMALAEGANMPLTPDAKKTIADSGILFGPAKAANAGGVAVSGLEISQNQSRRSMSCEQLAEALQDIMEQIHNRCAEAGEGKDGINYSKGANIAGLRKVADAMLAQGTF